MNPIEVEIFLFTLSLISGDAEFIEAAVTDLMSSVGLEITGVEQKD